MTVKVALTHRISGSIRTILFNKEYPVSINAVVPGMVATDFYRDIKIGADQEDNLESVPYVLKAFGVPVEEVGEFFMDISVFESQQYGVC
jgi:hypothetical protein